MSLSVIPITIMDSVVRQFERTGGKYGRRKEEVVDKKAEEKQRKKKKRQSRRKHSMQAESDELEEESGGSKVAVFFVSLLIIVVWFAIIALLIKWDVGGFGSGVLAPILKDVPYVNKILPDDAVEQVSTEDSAYAYDTMADAVERIKERKRTGRCTECIVCKCGLYQPVRSSITGITAI